MMEKGTDIVIRQALPDDLDLLIQWRMEVLHCVFSIPADADTSELRQQNIDYYRKRIVRWLVGAALSRGIKKIYLETSEAGRLLYSVLGFSDMKDMMHLSFYE